MGLNNWTKEYTERLVADGVSFKKLDLSGEVFDGFYLRGVDLRHSNLTGASLVGTDLRNARLFYTIFKDTDLSYTDLEGCDDVRFSYFYCGVKLDNANLSKVNLTQINLKRIGMLTNVNLQESNLKMANFSGMRLTKVNFQKSKLEMGNLRDTVFINCDLSGASLRGVNLNKANLTGMDLSNIDLRDYHKCKTDLKGVIYDSKALLTFNGRFGLFGYAHKSKLYKNPSQVYVNFNNLGGYFLEDLLTKSEDDFSLFASELNNNSDYKHYKDWLELVVKHFGIKFVV